MLERRTQRSERPYEAARLYLSAIAHAAGYTGLALADADGLLVVDALDLHIDSDAVAAIAALAFDDPKHSRDGLLNLVTRGDTLQVRDLTLHGQSFYLAAVGGTGTLPADAGLTLQRILA